jgi:hypothetical protein
VAHDGIELLTFGEVRTGLLQHSTALAQDRVVNILDLAVGERVRRSERPIPHAVSADRLTGVDCRLPSAARRESRCVGTVTAHATITGGHIVQGSAYSRVVRPQVGRRLPWSHYLARPGTLETIGKVDPADVVDGFVTTPRPGDLDLGAISTRLVDEIQRSSLLDRQPPFRTTRTRVRWVVLPTDRRHGAPRAAFRIDSSTDRTLEMRVDVDADTVVALCEDLALHDWLLTTLVRLTEVGLTAPGTRAQRVNRLRPAVDCLLHLWMPAARLDESVLPLWRSLDLRPGFTRQWQASVDRIRDQVALSMITLLEAGSAPSQ